ncbi:MAG TPA: hypothetical protein VNH18_16535, partial [Bryobacteraceae bacterium]|nr:hypothetical protein [Bryobacteraceae bacterium]
MKRLQTVLALLFTASVAPAQQYVASTVAGQNHVLGFFGDGQSALTAQLYLPVRVAADSKGNFYFCDYYTYRVRMVTGSTGIITTLAGNGTNAFAGDNDLGTNASISDAHGIAADSSGNVYIADTSNSRIRKVDTKGIIT